MRDLMEWWTVVLCVAISGAFAWATVADVNMRLERVNMRLEQVEEKLREIPIVITNEVKHERDSGLQVIH